MTEKLVELMQIGVDVFFGNELLTILFAGLQVVQIETDTITVVSN